MQVVCPLCGTPDPPRCAAAHGRAYHECSECGLIFLDPSARLGPDAERTRYETHENHPGDPGYRGFLDRLAVPLVERLPPGAHGLDYGSGPGPTLSLMLEERGFPMAIYDPFFAPDDAVLRRSWDFITCTETVEHFFDPAGEFSRLDRMLRSGGWLGIMTEWPPEDRSDFETWYYIRDPTHTCFYSPATLDWIAERFGWSLEVPGRNVSLFRKG